MTWCVAVVSGRSGYKDREQTLVIEPKEDSHRDRIGGIV